MLLASSTPASPAAAASALRGVAYSLDSADLLNESDPMLRALLENMVQLEQSLVAIRVRAQVLEESMRRLCRDMIETAACFAALCADDKALSAHAHSYRAACANVGSEGYANGALEQIRDMLALKVFEPVRANLGVIHEIKTRARARDALKKKLPRSVGAGAGAGITSEQDLELAKLTSRLFDELSALRQHRMDFIRGPFEAIKVASQRFCAEAASRLEASALEQSPRPSAAEMARARAIRPVTVAASGTIPVQGRFDPNADKVKAPPAAFARFVHDMPAASKMRNGFALNGDDDNDDKDDNHGGGDHRVASSAGDDDDDDDEFETVL